VFIVNAQATALDGLAAGCARDLAAFAAEIERAFA
jgi:hypothetical protein